MPIPVERLATCKKRIKSVLKDRYYATNRQLESKICESGPFNQRCDPHVVSQALREMVNSEELATIQHPQHNTKFYHLPEMLLKAKSRKILKARSEVIDPLYSRYLSFAQNDQRLCGDALETVMRDGFSQVPSFVELGSKQYPMMVFGELVLPGSLDGTFLLAEKKLLIAVETKNIREWIYPNSQELWSLVNKANTISSSSCPVLPVIICRKIPYYAYVAFKQLGILGFETHTQFFDPSIDDQLVDIKHKDGLGFHDIKTALVPPAGFVSFLEKTIPSYGPDYAARFLSHKSLLDQVAPQLALKNIHYSQRNALWLTVKVALGVEAAMSHHE